MLFFLIISHIIFVSYKNEFIENDGKLVTKIFIENFSSYNASFYFPNNKSKLLNYRERPSNIEFIRNNNKYKSYSSVYINNKTVENKINNFQNSKIFLINKENFEVSNNTISSNYDFIRYNDYFGNKSDNYTFTEKIIENRDQNLIIYCLLLFSIASFFMVCIFCCFYSSLWTTLEVNNMANLQLPLSMALSFSCVFYGFFRSISLMHSVYKSIMIVNLIYFLNGNQILYFQVQRAKKRRIAYTIIIILIETSTTIIFLNISIDDFYLFFIRNLIEHLTILLIGVKMFLSNFINLYKQYRLERIRMRTILTLAYKYKLIIYSKVFIFSFLYSLAFIIVKFIQIKYKNVEDGFLFIYYIDISLEIIFAIILSIIFFPLKHSTYFEIEFHNNINMYFLSEIKKDKEKNLQINNLNKKNMKEKYLKKEYPLVLLEPYAKTNNFINDCHMHIGIVKNK